MRKHDHLVVAINGAAVEVSVDPETCSRKGPDMINWMSPDGALEINFNKGGSPFINGSVFTSQGADQDTFPTAVVNPATTPGTYSYSVIVTLPDNTQIKADPQVIIDDGFTGFAQLLTFTETAVQQGVSVLLAQLADQAGTNEVKLAVSAAVGPVEVSIRIQPECDVPG